MRNEWQEKDETRIREKERGMERERERTTDPQWNVRCSNNWNQKAQHVKCSFGYCVDVVVLLSVLLLHSSLMNL